MTISPRNLSLAGATFLGGLILALIGAYQTRLHYRVAAQNQFDILSQQLSTEVEKRTTQPLYGLRALNGLYQGSEEVNRLEFRSFVDYRDLENEFPGVIGFGFIERVMRKDLDGFLASERADNASYFTLKGESYLDDLYVIKYIDPLLPNIKAWGYDVGSNDSQRATVERAIRTGQASLTEKVALSQDKNMSAGFLYLLPVYQQNSSPETPEERFKHLVGLAYCPIIIDQVFAQLVDRTGNLLDIEVFDGRIRTREHLLYDADDIMVSASISNGVHTFGNRLFNKTVTILIGGQEWTLIITSTDKFAAQVSSLAPLSVAVGGIVISILLAGMVFNLGTSRTRAEALAREITESLRTSERESKRLAMVASRTSNAVTITDDQSRIEWINEGFVRMTGYTLEEVKSRVPGSFLQGPLTDPDTIKLMHDGVKSGEGFKTEVINYHKDGHTYWVEIEVKPLKMDDGFITGYMAIESDITERKEAAQQLQANEQRLSSLTREVPGVIFQFEVTAEGKRSFTFFSEAYRELFGRDPEIVLKRAAILLTTVHEYDRRKVKTSLEKAIKTSTPWMCIFRIRRPDKSVRWIDARSTNSQGADGTKYWYGVLNNITETQQAKFFAETAQAKAEEANQAKSQFLAMMSHEIRTPMNGVIGMTSLLLDTDLNEEQREFTNIVRSSGESLLTLVNDILDFSKIESGKMELELTEFNIRDCAEGVLDLFAHKAAQLGIDLMYEIAHNVPSEIRGDVTRLRQIIVNLIGNALKFTEQGEVELNIYIARNEADQKELVISVRDTGIGISEEGIGKLFQSFSQVDNSTTRKYGGTGLGLAISKRLAELMGGRMWVESEVGVGSTFLFNIVPQWVSSKTKKYLPTERPNLSGKHVLIVDDNATNRRIISTLITKWGMSEVNVESGEAALATIEKEEPFDLAILDMQMPEMDGVMLATKIRQQPAYRELPLILLSSIGHQADESDMSVFDSVLSKPAKPSEIYDAIIKVLSTNTPFPIEVKAKSSQPIIDENTSHSDRILMAEDNTVNQKVALHMLAKLGYRCDSVANGQEAVDAIASRDYDVILMDMQMPEMDGLEATRTIRKNQRKDRQTPWIIALTANAMEGDRERCLEAGMNDYLSKPVKSSPLATALVKAREKRKGKQS